MSDILDSTKTLEKRCVNLANQLIALCKMPLHSVDHVEEINSDLIVMLFEKMTKLSVPDLLLCANKEEEAHNVQAVIDTLSLDLLGLSLSHITGEDVVQGNLVAVHNLLEILDNVALYLTSNNKENQNHSVKRKISARKKSSTSSRQKLLHLETESSELTENTSKDENDANRANEIKFSSQEHKFRPKMLKPNSSQGSQHQLNLDTMNPISSFGYPTSSTSISLQKSVKSDSAIISLKNRLDSPEDVQKAVSDSCILSKSQDNSLTRDANNGNKPNFDIKETVLNKSEKVPRDSQKRAVRNIKRKVSKLRHKINAASSVEQGQTVEELYEKNLEKKVRVLLRRKSPYKSRATHLTKVHLQSMNPPIQKPSLSACKKSFLLPHSLRHRPATQTSKKKKQSHKSQLPRNSTQQVLNRYNEPKTGFIQELYEEFPGLQLPPSIVNHIRKKYQDHLLKMHKRVKNYLLKKSKSQIQSEEVSKKQSLIANILKKDIKQQQYLEDYQNHKECENSIKYSLRDARLQSAKVKQYCDEFHEQMRKKMQKRNFTEELIFEKVFKDALTIQQDQVERLCKEVRETGESDAKQHRVYLEALENLYQTQFSMLSETLTAEKKDKQERIKAEKQAMNGMQRQFQEDLKKEIRFMQKVIVECMEDTHFRELDAEQYKDKLRILYS